MYCIHIISYFDTYFISGVIYGTSGVRQKTRRNTCKSEILKKLVSTKYTMKVIIYKFDLQRVKNINFKFCVIIERLIITTNTYPC